MRRAAILITIGALSLVLASCGAESVSPSSTETDAGSAATGCSSDEIAEDAGELTGVWTADDGGRYYLRQTGDCVWWFGTALQEVGDGEQPGFANVALGRLVDDELRLEWADVPLGDILGVGTLTLLLSDDGNQLTKASEAGTGFGGITWTRQDAMSNASASPDEGETASPGSSESTSPSPSP